MGLIYTDLRLANHARPDLEELTANALVDSGALHLCIPEHLALQLQLQAVEMREVILADGKPHRVAYVAPVRIELLGRHSVTGALVFGNQVLLGSIPMEDMDLIIEPARLRVSVNPRSPNIAVSVAMATPGTQVPLKLRRNGTEGEVSVGIGIGKRPKPSVE